MVTTVTRGIDSRLQQPPLIIEIAAIMMTAGTLKKIASALNVYGGDVTMNVSKIIPLQVFLS
jgi:hypothetical protein